MSVKELIEALKNDKWQEEQRKKMIPWAKEKYGWDKIAKQWSDEFNQNGLKEAMDTILKENSSADKFMPVQLQKEFGLKETY